MKRNNNFITTNDFIRELEYFVDNNAIDDNVLDLYGRLLKHVSVPEHFDLFEREHLYLQYHCDALKYEVSKRGLEKLLMLITKKINTNFNQNKATLLNI